MTDILYGKLRFDETFQYRWESVKVDGHVALAVCDGRHLKYSEWSALGIQLSSEWEHVSTHVEGRNVLLFRRYVPPLGKFDSKQLYRNDYEIEKYSKREQK